MRFSYQIDGLEQERRNSVANAQSYVFLALTHRDGIGNWKLFTEAQRGLSKTLKTVETEGCHDANLIVTGGTAGCLYDNLQCHQWRQSWHHDDAGFQRIAWFFWHTSLIMVILLLIRDHLPSKTTLRGGLSREVPLWCHVIPKLQTMVPVFIQQGERNLLFNMTMKSHNKTR